MKTIVLFIELPAIGDAAEGKIQVSENTVGKPRASALVASPWAPASAPILRTLPCIAD